MERTSVQRATVKRWIAGGMLAALLLAAGPAASPAFAQDGGTVTVTPGEPVITSRTHEDGGTIYYPSPDEAPTDAEVRDEED